MSVDEDPRATDRKPVQFLFPSRGNRGGQNTGYCARLVQEWFASIGLDPAKLGTDVLRRLTSEVPSISDMVGGFLRAIGRAQCDGRFR